MIKSDTLKGVAFAILGTLAVANVYIFSKAALTEVSLATFWFYWFLFSLFWYSIFLLLRGQTKGFFKLNRTQYFTIGKLGIFEVVGTSLFFMAINAIENPSIVSFIGNIGPVLVAGLGFTFLGERFNWKELVGIFITLIGVFTLSFRPGTNIGDMFVAGSEYMFLAAMVGAASTVFIKREVSNVKPVYLSLGRTLSLLLVSTLYIAYAGFPFELSTKAFINIALGSFLGPFLTITANYMSMRYIQATQLSIINSTKSLFVVIGAYFYFDILPFTYQLIGGFLTIVGVVAMVLSKKRRSLSK